MCFSKKTVIANRDYFGAITMMLKSISHRGPDDQKIYSNPTQGLHIGFCRLSMVDVKMSMQPFWDTNERTAVIFNGEIYNYKSLRKEVGETTFGTLGEVELILQLYKMYGESFIEQRLFGKGKDKQAEIQYSCGFVAGWLPKS